jgi:Zn-dependent M28 family amino/carboxypeptidase
VPKLFRSPGRAATRRIAPVAILGLVLAALLPAGAASAAPAGACDHRTNNTYQKLLECVTVEGVYEHLQQFQKIAEANDDQFYPGTRAAGTEGYDESVEYVAGLLREAGYQVTLDEFEFQFQFPAVLRQLTPVNAEYESGTFTGSPPGEVTGNVIPVDINLTGNRSTTSGCEASDFTGLDFSGPNDIALIQRGGPPPPAPTCSFAVKAVNAQNAGAEAVIIFNQGDLPTREALIVGTLVPSSEPITIPVVGASFANGVALAQPGSTAHVRVVPDETRTSVNVIAELPGRNTDNVVMAGAHLDSEIEGPGINDNGSGSAALLETALMMAKVKPENTLRFAWWGAEELGLVGSTEYVEGLSQAERDRIALYLNYDMVASPNYIFMVYDADRSTFPPPTGVPIPAGSTAIEDLYESYYTWVGVPYDDTLFSGRSDYQAFIAAGIPSGGLFTGAETPKNAEQEAIWGGTAGQQFDPCYHIACDDIDNLDLHALEVNSDAIAFVMLTYAYSTETVNGVPGKRVPGPKLTLPAPAGPEGTFA